MCLSTIDEKFIQYKIGYKVFRQHNDHFKSKIYRNPKVYRIGETYDSCKIKGGTLPKVISPLTLESYSAGFHFYTKYSDAKSVCSRDEAVVRIIPEIILATGIDISTQVGVCQIMTLDRLMYSYNNVFIKNRRRRVKKFKEYITSEYFKPLIELIKLSHQQKITSEEISKCIDILSDYEMFLQFIVWVDLSSRNSQFFKATTALWRKVNKSPILSSNMDRVTKEEHNDNPNSKWQIIKKQYNDINLDYDKVILGI